MSIAFMLLLSEAILVFSPQSSLLGKAPRSQKTKVHWITMLVALVCGAAGSFVIWYNKELNDKPHLVTWHGQVGAITMGYVAVQCVAGSAQLYPQMAMKYVKLAQLKIMHATSGLCLLLLATVSLVLGMYSNFFVSQVTGTSWYACMMCPLMLLLIITNQIKSNYLAQK
ncbi:hypothetical protein CAPTEDRAFT_172634 [Capitella teleta]|uniref:ascorbate ferrireductase (transmembrane) n=1 Tax=Capitella teleta TaxID=283909 RepID=R7UVW0_CAPTE|nr:hypothetical protein CAPTEDRAFT_172634 [Capitella teleta]|eukprot:ELU10402.1 hypothetical protein CAPTEDRAFT_172634 [Capitella teleta]